MPGSRLVMLDGAAHFPHLEDPDGLAATLRDFLATTAAARLDRATWHELMGEEPRLGAAQEVGPPARTGDPSRL